MKKMLVVAFVLCGFFGEVSSAQQIPRTDEAPEKGGFVQLGEELLKVISLIQSNMRALVTNPNPTCEDYAKAFRDIEVQLKKISTQIEKDQYSRLEKVVLDAFLGSAVQLNAEFKKELLSRNCIQA